MISEPCEETMRLKGIEILDARRERLRMEKEIKKRMSHTMTKEWIFWLGIAWCFANIYLFSLSTTSTLVLVHWLPAAIFILSSMEGAAMKREHALLEWLEYQRSQEKPQS